MRTPSRTADEALLRRAALRLGVQTAAAVAVTVVVLVSIAVLVVLRDQHRQQDDLLAGAVAGAEDVTDPPRDVWLVVEDASGRRATPGLPAGFPQEQDLRDTTRDGVVRDYHVKVGSVEYQVRTQRRGSDLVQGVLSLDDARRNRAHLITALLLSGVAGLLVAALAGAWLGRRAVAPLAGALELQRRFVADASHELRTPLTLLSTRAQLVRRALGRDADPVMVRAEVDGLVDDANRLAAILEDLLLAVDPRTGSARTPVDLLGVVVREVDAARPLAEQRGVVISVESVPGPVVVDGYEVGLGRAVKALVDNAMRHASNQVQVSLGVAGGRVVLEVVDDGLGIDPAMLPVLFERFASGADRTGPGPRRYGLGLALVAEIAARHGGVVSAHNACDGAVLRLTLPHHVT
jgi:signal transduction histidine kinase